MRLVSSYCHMLVTPTRWPRLVQQVAVWLINIALFLSPSSQSDFIQKHVISDQQLSCCHQVWLEIKIIHRPYCQTVRLKHRRRPSHKHQHVKNDKLWFIFSVQQNACLSVLCPCCKSEPLCGNKTVNGLKTHLLTSLEKKYNMPSIVVLKHTFFCLELPLRKRIRATLKNIFFSSEFCW